MADRYVCPDDGQEFADLAVVAEHEQETGHEVGIRLHEFYCECCRRWTTPDPVARGADREQSSPRCAACGEHYTCGECGFDINSRGECTRPVDFGFCPESVYREKVADGRSR